MPADVKVVSINSASSMKANEQTRVKLARLPAAVHLVQEKCKSTLIRALNKVFDNADDALFELADKADNNHDQNLFFESMREVRLRRRMMENAYADEIDKAFAQLSNHAVQTDDDLLHNEPSLDNLQLVQNDELEELVAVDSMISKAVRSSGEILQHLSLRLDSLVPLKVYQKNNPVGPEVICKAFATASKLLDADIKAKLVLFKLFEKYVVASLPTIYNALNALLVEQGILPSLKRERVKKQPTAPGVQNSQPPMADPSLSGLPVSGPSVSGNVQGHPHQSAGYGNGYGAGAAGYSGVSHGNSQGIAGSQGYAAGSGQAGQPGQSGQHYSGGAGTGGAAAQGGGPLEVGVIMGALAQLQANQVSNENLLQQPVSIESARVDLNKLLTTALLAQLPQGAKPGAIGGTEKDVINLVKVLFEFILDDRNLAEPMKALIGRMQIPVLKVALMDNSFFSKTGHPARRLLNEMATAALGWNEDGKTQQDLLKDSLYQKIAAVVQTLLSEFETDMSVFADLLADFVSFVEKERKRAKIIEQRTIDAESGKAQAEAARSYVSTELKKIIGAAIVPDPVQKILDVAWSNVLFLIYLKDGTGHEGWKKSLETAKDLVWSVTAPLTSDNRAQLMTLLPSLLKRLRNGLESISFNPYEMTQLMGQLEKIHLGRLRAPLQEPPPRDSKPVAVEVQKPIVDNSAVKPAPTAATANPAQTQEQTQESIAKPAPKVEAPRQVPANVDSKQVKPSVERPSVAVPAVENKKKEILKEKSKSGVQLQVIACNTTLPEKASKEASKPAAAETTADKTVATAAVEVSTNNEEVQPEYLEQVGKLTQGTWFEMNQKKVGQYRCRLAAIIKATGKFIFVNRNGQKVAEETKESLALALQNGTLRSLDDGMLFDRALQSVIGDLRKSRNN